MSHFTTTVIIKSAKDPKDAEAQAYDLLEPFNEELEVEKVVEGDEEYWRNPNARWDWYSVGGRWRGMWPVRSGADPEMWQGSEYGGVFNSEKRFDADIVRKGDIDFEFRLRQVTIEAEEEFTKWEQMTEGLDPAGFVPWSVCRQLVESKAQSIDNARAAYSGQEIVQRMRSVENRETFGFLSSPEDYFWGEDNPRERFVSAKRSGAFSTFAVLDDQGWHEKGKMGWFGMVADEKDQRAWDEQYQKMIDSLDDDVWLLNYDLHI